MILVYLLLIGIELLLALYYLQQFLNTHHIKTGNVKVAYVDNDHNKKVEKTLYTNKKPTFNFVFGVPGSGKTTCASYLAKQIDNQNKKLIKNGKKPLNIYANFNIYGIDYKRINVQDYIGRYSCKDGILLIDESSIDYNNRNTKLLMYDAIKYYKKHRHYCVSVYCFSQSYNDTDITLRRLADNYYHIYKSIFYIFNKHIILRKIHKFIFIEKERNEIIEGYKYRILSRFRINAKKYFKYFSSYERDLNLIGDENEFNSI